MKQCGRCGTQNRDQQTTCTVCGLDLPAAATGFGGTLVMTTPEAPVPEATVPQATVPEAPVPQAPVPEAPVPEAPVPEAPVPELPVPEAKKPPNLRGTMIGMAPPQFAPPTPAPATTSATTSPSQPPRPFAGTMIGMAPPAYPSPPPPPDAQPAAAGQGNAPRLASAHKTMLGVARPGIAPLNPGQAKPPVMAGAPPPGGAQPHAVAPPQQAGPSPMLWQGTAPLNLRSEGPISPRTPTPGRISLTATLAVVGSAMLLVMALLAYFMLRGHGSVTARASLDSKGSEQLDLSCSECPDGTKTWIDTDPSTFQGGKASLKLQTPLKVGENPILLVLERPGRSREEIALSIPIEFRVRSSTQELAQEVPKVSVLASVLTGTRLEVDGKVVPPDPNGEVRFDYEVAADVTGPEAAVTTLERVVPYKAVSANGATQSGKVQIRIGVTPLIVDAPGASIVLGDKEVVIAGRTAPGARLMLGTQTITLDPEGRFVSKQSLTAGENSFTVRSTLKELAPRLVKVTVRRSDNLEREAALARSMAQTSYVEVLRAGDTAIGRSLALEGQLFDVRHDGYTSVLLVDVKGGCKKVPCLSKVLYGVETSLQKGRSIKAFGKVVRFVDGPRTGERIPEVRADLVVAGGP